MPAALPKNDWDSPCGSHFAHLCAASINKRHEFNREPWKWKCSRDSANPALDFGHLDIIRYFLVALLRWTATLESDCVRAYALHTARFSHAQDTLWRVRKVLVPPPFFFSSSPALYRRVYSFSLVQHKETLAQVGQKN